MAGVLVAEGVDAEGVDPEEFLLSLSATDSKICGQFCKIHTLEKNYCITF